jgi:hypothetical protein
VPGNAGFRPGSADLRLAATAATNGVPVVGDAGTGAEKGGPARQGRQAGAVVPQYTEEQLARTLFVGNIVLAGGQKQAKARLRGAFAKCAALVCCVLSL